MAPSTGQISFTYGATEAAINAPEFGYQTELKFPFDFISMDNGTVVSRDEGSKYDKRICTCDCFLTAAQQAALNTLINTTARGHDLTLLLPAGNGFHPFGADKGDDGPFTVALMLKSTPAIQQAPYRYFKCQLQMTNTGAYPAYARPSEVAEGELAIDNVTGLRMPPTLFVPSQVYGVNVGLTEASVSRYFNRGSGADFARTQFVLPCNESKCAALLYDLVTVARAGAFDVTSADSFYMFGVDHGSSDTYSVRLLSDTIVVKHNRYNEFELSMDLQRIS